MKTLTVSVTGEALGGAKICVKWQSKGDKGKLPKLN